MTQGGRRVLLIANAAPTEAQARHTIMADEELPVFEVLAPVLQSRTHFMTTDIDHETQDARERLSETLAWLRGRGFAASGVIGDPIDPTAGVADELRRFEVDEIVLMTHPLEQANWIERTMLTSLREELDVPVKHVVVGPAQVASFA